ncbi:methylated-DNA--[protein]-cysteine S-methyltransferase [Pseudomarimonas arenosa]|uniref:Methylated-DNA--protein-cysteine methyltransferase n=1 Tax=Pseudomarimonas arenosa TaxID=2774145 RepID=A0AAW3ZKM7_9GAMM|nr:methylated-DNA--[protein]-cysteine S-methyltransferase [Pseudomarimonas arenosa]
MRAELETPVGELILIADEVGLRALRLPQGRPLASDADIPRDPRRLRPFLTQLQAYFAGELRQFDLPLSPTGTDFQCAVWWALAEIPYGETMSYSAMAAKIGRPRAVRAVGAANGANPLPIVLPCHRVIGRDGSLTGFAGGLACKAWLLAHERRLRGERQADLWG